MFKTYSLLWIFPWILLALAGSAQIASAAKNEEPKPHAVFVVGTRHYNPHLSMPPLAEQLEQAGFRTTIVTSDRDPEHDTRGLDGLEALETADVAVFYLRFLTLPKDQQSKITRYLESGKPVVAFRTSTHAFDYPKESPLAEWNDGFGKRAMGTKYFIHMATPTKLTITNESHPIVKDLAWPKTTTVPGKLYLVDLPQHAKVLFSGNGKPKRTGRIKNRFGTHEIKDSMSAPVAWTWKNEWGGRVFGTTLGHVDTFKDPQFVRLFVNGICWAADKPMLAADVPVGKIEDGTLIAQAPKRKVADAKNRKADKPAPPEDPEYAKYAIFEKTAARPKPASNGPSTTVLPLKLEPGATIAYIGNTMLDRARHFGYLEAAIHETHPKHNLVVRNLCWAADTPSIQPRPMNFADLEQHLTHIQADVIFASFGFNESFKGEEGLEQFQQSLGSYATSLRSLAFNGESAPKVVLFSPTANDNIPGVPAGDLNNENLRAYTEVIRKVAKEQGLGFVNLFTQSELDMKRSKESRFTINGSHLSESGYGLLAATAFPQLFGKELPGIRISLREAVVDKNRQFFRRYRPANTFYYTGGRNKSYGYLDFLPAMKNFDLMVANRDARIWAMARGEKVPKVVDDSNVPLLPQTKESRGANEYLSAEDELKAFKVDPRFEVNLFAGEEQFADLGAPIQMRWDSEGRLWVACSTTYPHVYPGNEPNDKLIILEDTNKDGRADKSTVFADDLHIPLSFEFAPVGGGGYGVYVSEMPDLTLIEDTDGDGKADKRTRVLTGFGTEDSHHALHDFTWTPDGDLIWREGIFHHTQVETPYGPVRQANSGWYRFQPKTQKLTGFGTYHSTNPWGVTFDDWGQHMASHPIYAEAFHSLDPPYPLQHPRATGLQAYSGTCGQEFVDFPNWPAEMQGNFIKVRYKPTNRVEIHKWKEGKFGYEEEYVSDLIFSTNLSFIPVDLQYGPRGAMYICDWYNPVKGHAQYSLRDDRRDRHSGRIWRIVPKDAELVDPPDNFATTSLQKLIEITKRPEYRYRYWAKRELRNRTLEYPLIKKELDLWVKALDKSDPRFRHHQMEAIWMYRGIGETNIDLLRELLACDDHHARAAAMKQFRYWHADMPDAAELLRAGANDSNGIVRMQSAITASYIGTKEALDAILDIFNHPQGGHLSYAVSCALGSAPLRQHWEGNPEYKIARLLNKAKRNNELKEPSPSASQAEFDTQKDLKVVRISCEPERMLFTVKRFDAKPGQPIKLVFTNPDATDHNLLIVRDGALEEVGMAANDMARNPKNANSNFIPRTKRKLIVEASPMIGPTRKSRVHVMRFDAPTEPGVYPYVCTFPGHWVVMRGDMVIADDAQQAEKIFAARKPAIQKEWKVADFENFETKSDELTMMRGMKSFMKANCHQCHAVGGHGVNLGPDLTGIGKRFKGRDLLRHILEPSFEINEKFQAVQVLDDSGLEYAGVLQSETDKAITLIPNLLTPKKTQTIQKATIEHRGKSKVSSMPAGLANVLTKVEIEDLVSFLEHDGYKLPTHLKGHDH